MRPVDFIDKRVFEPKEDVKVRPFLPWIERSGHRSHPFRPPYRSSFAAPRAWVRCKRCGSFEASISQQVDFVSGLHLPRPRPRAVATAAAQAPNATAITVVEARDRGFQLHSTVTLQPATRPVGPRRPSSWEVRRALRRPRRRELRAAPLQVHLYARARPLAVTI